MTAQRVTVRLAGAEVAKWAANRTVKPNAPALPSGRVVVVALDAPTYRDTEPSADTLTVPYIGEDAALEVAVVDVNQRDAVAAIRVALELADMALGGLVARSDRVSVEVER